MSFKIKIGAGRPGGDSLTPALGLLSSLILTLCLACGPAAKLSKLAEDRVGATIRLPTETEELQNSGVEASSRSYEKDTMRIIGPDGRELLLMEAVLDEESGEMVATDKIDAAFVTARFRHIAERGGMVRMEFQVVVPQSLQDPKWQLRLHPVVYMLSDSLRLDDILITGSDYRKAQLRGYEQYSRFLSRIITDSTMLVDERSLELFLKRNIPELYAYKQDTSFVSDEDFQSSFGLGFEQVKTHYTRWLLVRRNAFLHSIKDRKRRQYIRAPLRTESVRLDTVRRDDGLFEYNYVQFLSSKPGLRKIELCLDGELYESDKKLYTVARSEPLTYYVSSVSTFADDTPRYMTKVISRKVEANESCSIAFEQAKSDVLESMGDNAAEIAKIKSRLSDLMQETSLELDSIVVYSTSSPEGSLKSNLRLSYDRSRAVSSYFSAFLRHLKDSLRVEQGALLSLGEDALKTDGKDIEFVCRSAGENWTFLDALVEADTLMSDRDKSAYLSLRRIEELDQREACLRESPAYGYIASELYPKLRKVSFDFHLHRKDMRKDTVHTTLIDSTYMQAVQFLKDQQYALAVEQLLPYSDFNSALACVALGRNATAMAILSDCPPTAKVLYLKAILFSRAGDPKQAIEQYLQASSLDPSLVHRANLDPEIASLKQKFNL